MANGKIRFGKQSGGELALVIPDGVDNTEVTFPESGILAKTSDINTAGVELKTIATGTATFTATTNNINLTGIGIGVEIGDVIQITGAEDVKNNSEFTVEVITDDNNIIVNQAHANKGTTKNVATRVNDANVTVKLLSKWYNADDKLGRYWVDVSASRIFGVSYPNNTNRAFAISGWFSLDNSVYVVANLTIGSTVTQQIELANSENIPFYSSVPKGENYSFSKSGSGNLVISVKEYR